LTVSFIHHVVKMRYLHNAHVKQVPVTMARHTLWLCEWSRWATDMDGSRKYIEWAIMERDTKWSSKSRVGCRANSSP